MEDDEDDLYGGSASANGQASFQQSAGNGGDVASKEERMGDVSEEEDDSDDDVKFTLEKPTVAKSESTPQTGAVSKVEASDRAGSADPRTRRAASTVKQEASTPQAAQTAKGTLTYNGKEGKDFPEVRSSAVDLEENPTWPGNGKKITDVDIDADLAELSKPWRLPGTDQTDFFNYGFDEYTWALYCAKQRDMAQMIGDQKDEDARMKAMLGGDMPNGGEGMPDMNQMMQMMFGGGGGGGAGGMGMDPSKMDFGQMMAMMGGGGPMPGMPGGGQGGPGQQQGGGGFGGQGGYGGPGGAASPLPPQGGQGFQPPTGPAAHQNQGQMGGFPGGNNIDGYSPQQLAIMQQEQQGPGGGGGGRGRGRRGRGFY